MSSYVFLDTGSAMAFGKAGLLNLLLPENNGGRQLVVVAELITELQMLVNTNDPEKPYAQAALDWLNAPENVNRYIRTDTEFNAPGLDAAEKTIKQA